MSAQARGNRDHYSENDAATSDRWINVARGPDDRPWAAVRIERAGSSRIHLLGCDGTEGRLTRIVETGTAGEPERASLVVSQAGDVNMAWNEFVDGRWRISHGRLPTGGGQSTFASGVVASNPGLCMTPAIVEAYGALWIAWSMLIENRMRIVLAKLDAAGQWRTQTLSTAGEHSFRPALAGSPAGLLVAWDRYSGGRYVIEFGLITEDQSFRLLHTLGQDGRNRLMPTVAATAGGPSHIAFVETIEVRDKSKGIVDHASFILSARIDNDTYTWVHGEADGGPIPSADLRPGLLAGEGETHRCYDGLRRRPQLSTCIDGTTWLSWESRDTAGAKRDGRLMGKCLADGSADTMLLHEGAACYAVAPEFRDGSLTVACAPLVVETEPIIDSLHVSLANARMCASEPAAWRRWTGCAPVATSDTKLSAKTDDGPMRLYWLDLHCHSVKSPDAEGEPDELLHYARDFAGLDGVAIVDNDYYPNKTLADSEWRAQQDLAELFSVRDQFVVFPAYEYTYHDDELTPDFNHRYVLYPHTGRLLRRVDPESNTVEKLAEALHGEDALLVAHHCTWRLTGFSNENVEVCSSWRICIEETDFVHRRLAAGDRFGFIATSDSHRACPGMGGALTGVYAKELTPDAIFEGLCRRRTVATQGERVHVDFNVNGIFIGGESAIDDTPSLHIRLDAPRPVEFIEIIRDGNVAHRIGNPDRQMTCDFADVDVGPGTHYYFVRVKMEGDPSFNAPGQPDLQHPFIITGDYPHNLANARGPFAWTSPVWVDFHSSIAQ